MKSVAQKVVVATALPVLAGVLFYQNIEPSNDRAWAIDQAILPHAEVIGDKVTIHNIRNFTYRTTTDYTPAYYDKTFNLRNLERVYFVVEPFSGYLGAAHTFLSFEFTGNDFLAISVEIRKEKGESFSAIKGVAQQYELMYVVADERDAIKLRSNYRHDDVYVYPVKADADKARAVFMTMLARINKLYTQPEFYNTVTNNCTTNIARHVNEITPRRIPWNLTLLMPENADRYAFELGLLDTELKDFTAVREAFKINTLAEKYADDPEFSLRIRGR